MRPEILHRMLEEKFWDIYRTQDETLRSLLIQEVRSGDARHSVKLRMEATSRYLVASSSYLRESASLAWLMLKGVRPHEVKGFLQERIQEEMTIKRRRISSISSAGLSKKKRRAVESKVRELTISINSAITETFADLRDPVTERRISTGEAPGYNPRTVILFCSADSARTQDGQRPATALNLDNELREVQKAIQRGKLRDHIDVKVAPALTMRELVKAVNFHDPKIVHFGGHGSQEGIWVVDEEGSRSLASNDFLSNLFLSCPSVKLVVLNSCYSSSQARIISAAVGPTFGTPTAIRDDLAVEFSSILYSAIADGKPLRTAVDQVATFFEERNCPDLPQLHNHKNVDVSKLHLVKDPKDLDYSMMISGLHMAVKSFLSRNKKLVKLYSDSYQVTQSIDKYGIDIALPEDWRTKLSECNADFFDQEVERIDDILIEIGSIIRRWSAHLSPGTLNKLEQLEDSISSLKPHVVRAVRLTKKTFKVISREDGSREQTALWLEFLRLLGGLGQFDQQLRSSVRLYFNQALELIPGGPDSGKFLIEDG